MWKGANSFLGQVPLAVWALLLMALFSFGVFHYKQQLQMDSYERIIPLEKQVSEAAYQLSKGYIHLEKFAAKRSEIQPSDVFSCIEQAHSMIRTAAIRLKGKNKPPRISDGGICIDLEERFSRLQSVLGIFLDLTYKRVDSSAESSDLLGIQQHKLYNEAEGIMEEVISDLQMRAGLLEHKQQRINTLLSGAWVGFAVVMAMVIVRIDRKGRAWERALARSEARMRSIFTALPDPVLVIDHTGTILDVPSPSDSLLPDVPDRIKGTNIQTLVGEEKAPRAVQLINEVLADGKLRILEYEQQANKRKFHFEGRIVSLNDRGNQRVLWIAHDLTEFRKSQERRIDLERRIQQAQKMESLGVMAGGIAHDFDNLLTSVMGHAEVAMTAVEPGSEMSENLQEIHTASCRAAELAAQMLKYSGNTHLAFDTVDLCSLIADLEAELRHRIPESINLEFNCPGEGALFDGDYEHLHQAARNLALNAAEAIGNENNGRIVISAGIRDCTREELQDNYLKESHPPGEYAFIKVEDNGCGIPSDDYERLFDPFFTTKFTGRGLGLAAVQGIVRSHDGLIRVHSKPGKGTWFEILLPVAKRVPSELDVPDYSGIL